MRSQSLILQILQKTHSRSHKNQKGVLLYEKEIEKKMLDGETAKQAAQRALSVSRDYRHNFEQTHCRIHYCHKGHFICPICPLPTAIDELASDAIDQATILRKIYKKEFTRKYKKNGTYYWSLLAI